MRNICVFTGSSPGARTAYAEAARELGALLVERGLSLVYGGANVGLMGIIADTVLAHGGRVVGVIPEGVLAREVAHENLTELHIVGSMHERKSMMEELSDAVIALPGGLGTLDEFFEMLTWGQLGLHAKPCGLLNVEGYYDKLLDFLAHSVGERFVKAEHHGMILAEADPSTLLDRMANYDAPPQAKWIDRNSS